MVWAMALPGNFGDFFPSGDFVGWDERLCKHFNDEMLPARQKLFPHGSSSYALYVSEKLKNERGSISFPELPAFSPVESHEPPEWFETEKRQKSLGSIVELTNRLLAVDEALKDIIERLDPGVHEFFPLHITMPKGEVYPKRYFVIVVGRYLESFLREKSKPDAWRRDSEAYPEYYSLEDDDKNHVKNLVFSKSNIGDAHLWRERYNTSATVFFSDTLQAEISKAGLRLPKHFRAQEI